MLNSKTIFVALYGMGDRSPLPNRLLFRAFSLSMRYAAISELSSAAVAEQKSYLTGFENALAVDYAARTLGRFRSRTVQLIGFKSSKIGRVIALQATLCAGPANKVTGFLLRSKPFKAGPSFARGPNLRNEPAAAAAVPAPMPNLLSALPANDPALSAGGRWASLD